MDWTGQVCVVTGAGIGSGLGIAEVFAEAGCQVVIGEVNRERGQAAAGDLQRRDGRGWDGQRSARMRRYAAREGTGGLVPCL